MQPLLVVNRQCLPLTGIPDHHLLIDSYRERQQTLLRHGQLISRLTVLKDVSCGASQALGLSSEVVDLCFKGTASRIGGVGFHQLAADAIALHDAAYKVS